MIVTPEFPEHRLQDPRRQAEWRVYQEIAGSQAPGRALYEMRAGLHAPQLDFGIWLQDVAHYGLQVKGGENATEGGEWRLHSANGPETIPSPIAQTFDAAIAIRDIIKAAAGGRGRGGTRGSDGRAGALRPLAALRHRGRPVSESDDQMVAFIRSAWPIATPP